MVDSDNSKDIITLQLVKEVNYFEIYNISFNLNEFDRIKKVRVLSGSNIRFKYRFNLRIVRIIIKRALRAESFNID